MERPRAFSGSFGAVKVLKISKNQKLSTTKKNFGRKITCWELFETVVAEVSERMELILGGKRSFEVWRTAPCVRLRTYEKSF